MQLVLDNIFDNKMGYLKYYSITLAIIINFMCVSTLIDPNCDYYQDLTMGQEYYIYNQQYPNNYGPSTSCKWAAKSEVGTRIVVACEDITLPNSSGCSGDHLAISLSGNQDFSDSRNYCGSGRVSLVTDRNSLAVGLFATRNSRGGRFVCTLTAIQDPTATTTESPPNICDCGWKKETRIVGGVETGVNEYPPMAGIVDIVQKTVYCGGTIISERYIVTAAHCVLNRNISTLAIIVGDHDISTGLDTSSATLHKISAFEMHPGYNTDTLANDIALIQTKTPIIFNLRVGPACLPLRFTNVYFIGQTVTVLGWGQIEFSGPTSDTLQKTDLAVIPNTECVQRYKEEITDNQMCTYALGKDACQSDSGGPLLWTDPSTRRLHLVGIISFGVGCGSTVPGVNTRVTSYLSWIISRTSDALYCIL